MAIKIHKNNRPIYNKILNIRNVYQKLKIKMNKIFLKWVKP